MIGLLARYRATPHILTAGQRKTITDFTIRCDKKPFVQVLIGFTTWNAGDNFVKKTEASVPVVVKRNDLYGFELENELNIAPDVANYIESRFTSNIFDSSNGLTLHDIHIPKEGKRPSFVVTVRIFYKRLPRMSIFQPARTNRAQVWYVDKIMKCEKALLEDKPKSYPDEDCCFCLEPLDANESVVNKCGHYYHKDCLAIYQVTGGNKCPICRHPINLQ
jgi:hypothetical protein